MARCKNCGYWVNEDARLCPRCGYIFDMEYVRDIEYAKELARAQMEVQIHNANVEREYEKWKVKTVQKLRSQFRYKTASVEDLSIMIFTIDKKIVELTDDIEGLSNVSPSHSEAHKFMRKELARIQIGACKQIKKKFPPAVSNFFMPPVIYKEAYKRAKKYARSELLGLIILYCVITISILIIGTIFGF